jgi:hypothetical protein
MGRFSQVNAYSDTNPNMRAISHSDATSSVTSNTKLTTEKVYNPYGSTAGAGSGEFHIYRHARAREMERLKAMDEKEINLNEQVTYDTKIRNWDKECEDKTDKKRKKRMRYKASKLRKKNMNLSGVIDSNGGGSSSNIGGSDSGSGSGNGNGNKNAVDDEFEYTPLEQLRKNDEKEKKEATAAAVAVATAANDDDDDKVDNNKSKGGNKDDASKEDVVKGTNQDENEEKSSSSSSSQPSQPPMQFRNDGSFMEMMKKMQSAKK